MVVHNHGIDPSCGERKVGECLLSKNAIVLDLTEWEARELASWLDGTDNHMSIGDRLQVARSIRKQVKPPPRIPEPGLWGVVEAGATSGWADKRVPWLRRPDGWAPAVSGAFSRPRNWDDLIDPVLIREGL